MIERTERDDIHQLTSVGIAVGAIWTAVGAISLFAPDMVSGSEQQHMPVAAFTTWIFGLLATQGVIGFWVKTRRNGSASTYLQRAFALAVAGIWTVAGAVAVFSPEVVTGSDPTRIPVAAILAPIVALIVTRVAADLTRTVVEDGLPAHPL